MFKIEEVNNYDTHVIITFTDNNEAYGALMILEENQLYVEFMEFDGDELKVITEEEFPEEYQRLEEKYINDLIDAIDGD